MAKTGRMAASATVDPDVELLRRVAAQEADALEELYRIHAPGLLAFLVGRLDDVRLAEEVLQEVMLAAWHAAPRFRGECRVRTWLLAIARTRAINAYHREIERTDRETPLLTTHGEPFTADISSESTDLHTALQALPAEQRETLELVFYHGLSLQETALVQKIALGTVKSRLHRAKAHLRQGLAPGNDADD